MVASMPQEYTIILEWEPIVTVPQRFPRSRVPVQWGRACERGHLEVGITGQTCGVWLDLAAWPRSGTASVDVCGTCGFDAGAQNSMPSMSTDHAELSCGEHTGSTRASGQRARENERRHG